MTEHKKQSQGHRVLVVDDDMGMRILMRESLEQEGFEIEEAEDGKQAVELFEDFQPDIILMDVEMPVMDGFSACEALRKLPEGKHTPILMVTGSDDIESVNRAYEVGATDFCIKPINFGVIGRRVRYILRASKAFKALSKSEARLRYLAYYDALTGLPNRQLSLERLDRALHIAKRYSRVLAVLYVDIDRFKRINDTLGHSVGDALLKAVGERLESCVRTTDSVARTAPEDSIITVGRLAGDEFTLLLPEIECAADASIVARRILNSFEQPFTASGHELFVTPSIGIAVYPSDGQDAGTLLKNADMAMYHSKHEGRNGYHFYTASLMARTQEGLSLENKLRRALEREELFLHYQPKVQVRTGRVVGVEALLRWQHPELGLISPTKFIPLAEEMGLIVQVGEWVLRTACRQNKVWQAAGLPPIPVAVNISSHQFRHGNLLKTIPNILNESCLDPSYLELELTETSIMVDAKSTITTLNELKKMGLKISVDDFGTGYSSLNYLRQFPIDTLKIDRSFIKDITTISEDSAITAAIIAMAHRLHLNVIAEGVETEEQLAFLKDYGCDEIQGHLFCKPMAVDEVTRFLEENATNNRAVA